MVSNKDLKGKKIIVTGGAGFIGSNLVDALIDCGAEVHVIDNLVAGKKNNLNKKAKLHKKDIRVLKDIKNIFKGVDYVFHMAALPRVQFSIENPVESFETNVLGTLNVLEASRLAKVKKVINSSSSAVYGDQDIPSIEDMLPKPKSPYALHKYKSELLCKLYNDIYGLNSVSLRYFNVYGPRLDPEGAYALVIGRFLKQRINNEPLTITGTGEQTRDFTHVKDVVRANIFAMKNDNIGNADVYNIGFGKNISINQLAKIIGGEIMYIPARLEPTHTLSNITKAKERLGWIPEVDLNTGIDELKKIWKIKD